MAAAGDVDQPFEDEHDLRAAGAAIGRGRGGVRDHRAAAHVRAWDVVDAGGHGDPLGERDKRNRAGSQIAGVYRAEGQKAAILVERKLRLGGQVAAVEISGECIAALARPFDRPPHSSRRPGDQRKIWIGVVADPEISADIARDHADCGSGTPRTAAMSSRCRTTPPPAVVYTVYCAAAHRRRRPPPATPSARRSPD